MFRWSRDDANVNCKKWKFNECHHIWYISNVWFIQVCMEIRSKPNFEVNTMLLENDAQDISKPFIFNSIFLFVCTLILGIYD
jgi:hypothetical protein